MTVDLEAIARRTNCELTSLRSAVPLIEQGYTPPFLARYRRDELGGLGEHAMWTLYRAMRDEAWIKARRDDLIHRLEQLPQADPALARAVRSASSKRVIDRLARRVRSESTDVGSPSMRVASRILSPERGDPSDVAAIAAAMGLETEATTIESNLDAALAARLAGHPQMQSAAVRWLFNNAKIRILSVRDTHADSGTDNESAQPAPVEAAIATSLAVEAGEQLSSVPTSASTDDAGSELVEASTSDAATSDASLSDLAAAESAAMDAAIKESASLESSEHESQNEEGDSEAGSESKQEESSWPSPEDLIATPTPELVVAEAAVAEGSVADNAVPIGDTAAAEPRKPREKQSGKGKGKGNANSKPNSNSNSKPQAKAKEVKQVKKISPRQRRRRWLVSVLQPLAGKEILAQKLTAFQTLMIGRGLRSGVVQCQFVYDTDKLMDQLQRTATGLNESFSARLRMIVGANDALIRETAEAAWWDELLETAATRLVSVAADHLESQINRGGVEAKVVLSIDAMGPRTAAVAIVAADGRLIHTEDIPCQLSAALRSAAVTRVGELIHRFGVDLIVISNGPARRACLVILNELVTQSAPGSVRWTIAERSGADVYAGSELANREMRSTPRRFRSAAWLAFSVLRPSQAVTKVDPMRLRLGSFQRELSEDALWPALRDVMTSGVSRGGVDVNSAPVDWLCQLPGVSLEVATAIDKRRRESLFTSRSEVAELEQWVDPKDTRQAVGFLRVFGSNETLDGTLIHPDDYALAKKLSTALKIELPPQAPPGYEPPNFEESASGTSHPASDVHSPLVEDLTADGSGTDSLDFAAEIQPTNETEMLADDVAQSDEVPSPEDEAVSEPVAAAEFTADAGPEVAATAPAPASSKTTVTVEVHPPVRRPMPESAQVNKVIKEWQVGARRVRHVVDALCDPFGDEDTTANGVAHAVMTRVPKIADLTVGDQVIGVIVGVTEFGAFVEMSPECSGLIHVSRVADRFVEDLHEAVQVGDVVTAWVTNIDTKRRRVGLSAISPQREAELERQRQERRDESNQRGYGSRPQRGEQSRGGRGDNRSSDNRSSDNRTSDNRGGDNRAGDNRGSRGSEPSRAPQATGASPPSSTQSSSAPRGDSRGRNDSRPDSRGDSRPDNRSGVRGGSGQGGSGQGGSGRGDSRGDNRGGNQRGGQRGGRRDDRDDGPSSYSTRVPRSDTPAIPLTDAMAKGDEPLRSFGDLLQFFKKATPEPVIKPKKVEPAAETVSPELSAADTASPQPDNQPEATKQAESSADGATPES